MKSDNKLKEILNSVHEAEQAVYHAQTNSNEEELQKANQLVKLAKEMVNDMGHHLTKMSLEDQNRFHQAKEHLKHLEEAETALL